MDRLQYLLYHPLRAKRVSRSNVLAGNKLFLEKITSIIKQDYIKNITFSLRQSHENCYILSTKSNINIINNVF